MPGDSLPGKGPRHTGNPYPGFAGAHAALVRSASCGSLLLAARQRVSSTVPLVPSLPAVSAPCPPRRNFPFQYLPFHSGRFRNSLGRFFLNLESRKPRRRALCGVAAGIWRGSWHPFCFGDVRLFSSGAAFLRFLRSSAVSVRKTRFYDISVQTRDSFASPSRMRSTIYAARAALAFS